MIFEALSHLFIDEAVHLFFLFLVLGTRLLLELSVETLTFLEFFQTTSAHASVFEFEFTLWFDLFESVFGFSREFLLFVNTSGESSQRKSDQRGMGG